MIEISKKYLKSLLIIFKFGNINLLKNYSFNQFEIILLSFVFFLNSIISARNLSSFEYGNYAIIYSIFVLVQGFYTSCIGETFLIKKNSIYNKQSISEIIFFVKYLILIMICLGFLLHFFFNTNINNLIIYFISIFNLIIMQNNRYYFLSYNLNIKSIINTCLFLIFFILSLLTLTKFNISLSTSYLYFSLLGFSAFLVNLINLKQIDFKNKVSNLENNKRFILKSFYSNILFWCSGNLHWLLLGYFSKESLGIIKACLAIINPIQTITRGMSITIYKILNKNNNIRTFLKLIIFASIFSFITIFIWNIAPFKVLEFTVGQKYFAYKNAISIIMFIPGLGFIASMGNAFLKFNNFFKPIYFSNIIISLFLSGYIIFNQENYDINNIALVILTAVIINLGILASFTCRKLILNLNNQN